ncbi:hypothetical protein [Clostridium tyrobutyricum]|uniref:hypothetical protein n=1 Tax=Clostridium tyrobutyricum TaxID=1519 RepID=UPI002B221068|nr:hypothetical protein [Clostridium tyrobutyricum]MEA5008758.1 hypothetical protein [Clostridium tyrobutyricum]
MKEKLPYAKMSNEQIFDLFVKMYFKIRPKDATEYIKKGNTPSLYIIKKRLNLTWNEIKIKADLGNLKYVRKNKSDYIEIIKNLELKLGHIPNQNELKNNNISMSFLLKKFNVTTYSDLLKIFFNKNYIYKTHVQVKESDEELLEMYKNFCKKLGRVATTQNLNESKKIYNAAIFTIRFGSMANLRILAGYEPYIRQHYQKYTKFKILDILKQKYIKFKRPLTIEEIRNDEDIPNHITILRYFKTTSMKTVWKEIEQELIKDYIKKTNNKD